eukprot:1178220-Prorocentrum_minimum.AAC.4
MRARLAVCVFNAQRFVCLNNARVVLELEGFWGFRVLGQGRAQHPAGLRTRHTHTYHVRRALDGNSTTAQRNSVNDDVTQT